MVRQRTTRKDPDQEAIVRSKDNINTRTTELIKLLIELKRAWNGNPAPDIGIQQKYNLTDPMPDEIVNSGQGVLHKLDSIINDLRQIDSMQDSYAEKRNQRLTERMQQMQALQQQAVQNQGITKEASNKLTRLWSHIVAPFRSDRGKWERLRLLRALGRVDKNLKEINDKILAGDPAVFEAIYLAKQMYLDAKGSFFDDFRVNLTKMLEATDTEVKRLQEETKQEENIQKQKLREEVERKQGPLRREPISVSKRTPPREVFLDQLDKVQEQIQKQKAKNTETKETTNVVERQLRQEPARVPMIVEPEQVPEPEQQQEQPEEIKAPDLAAFIQGKSTDIYRNIQNALVQYQNAPEVWLNRIKTQWGTFIKYLKEIQESRTNRQIIISYLHFIKTAGDLTSTITHLGNELMLQQQNPDFVFGSGIDEGQMENEAINFLRSYQEEIQNLFGKKVVQAGETSRWLKRMLTYVIGGRDKSIRLDVDRLIRGTRNDLQVVMDNLEKPHLNFRLLIRNSENFYKRISELYLRIADLAEAYNSRMKVERYKSRKTRSYNIISPVDISSLRSIAKIIISDLDTIHNLGDLEDSIAKIQYGIEG